MVRHFWLASTRAIDSQQQERSQSRPHRANRAWAPCTGHPRIRPVRSSSRPRPIAPPPIGTPLSRHTSHDRNRTAKPPFSTGRRAMNSPTMAASVRSDTADRSLRSVPLILTAKCAPRARRADACEAHIAQRPQQRASKASDARRWLRGRTNAEPTWTPAPARSADSTARQTCARAHTSTPFRRRAALGEIRSSMDNIARKENHARADGLRGACIR